MTPQSPAQLGICSWSTHPKDPADLAARMKELGLNKVQLYLVPVFQEPKVWGDVKALLAVAGTTIVSGMFGSIGEDYSTLESIRKTGGFIQDQHWDANWKSAQAVAATAQKLGLVLVSTHAGFIPDNAGDPNFAKLRQRLALIADLFADHGLTLVFETGQETADALNRFLDQLNRTNVGINFDPANMILYAKGDPVASLRKLAPRVRQCHVKDATKTKTPGSWGVEVAIGDGEVDWRGFIQALSEANFRGNLVIEREAGQDRVGDVRKAIQRISAAMQQAV